MYQFYKFIYISFDYDYVLHIVNFAMLYSTGNDVIHSLTKTNQELRVEVTSFDDEEAYALYSTFQIGNESNKYQITVSGYSGTAGMCLLRNFMIFHKILLNYG
jgi:hypothetical protein